MDFTLTFFLCAAPAIILFGIAKGAAIGSLALIAIPLMLLVMPLPQVLAVCLPLLIIMDWIAFYKYRKSFSKENLKFMIPAGLIGTIIGYYTFSFFEEKHLKLIIGFIGLFFTLNYYIKINKEIIKQNTSMIKGSFWSIASGFAGFCAHSGGTPISVYLVPLRLEKTKYVGTRITYFFFLNIFKLIFYIPLNFINFENLKLSLMLAPFIPVGILVGFWIVKNVSQKIFYNIVYAVIFLSSLKLIYENFFRVF